MFLLIFSLPTGKQAGIRASFPQFPNVNERVFMHRYFRWMLLAPLLTITACTTVTPSLPSITEAGKVLFSDNFQEKSIDTNHWISVKGTWTIADGAVRGVELESDHHPAVLRVDVPFEDALIRFRFKMDGSDFISLSLNQATGHHSHVIITPEGFALQKNGNKKDPRSLTLPLGRCNVPLKSGVWYTMTVECCGDNMLVCLDDKHFIIGTQDQIHTPKTNIGLVVRGSSASFDDISVRTALPSAGKSALIGQLRAQQAVRHDVASDPRTVYSEAETLLRNNLMQSDPAFNQLLNNRIALDNDMHKRWPKAFRAGSGSLEVRKGLLANDAEFKTLNTKLARARKAELDYLLKQSPELAKLREVMLKAQRTK